MRGTPAAVRAKALLGARSQLLSMSLALENQIRGVLKTFGRIVPKGAGGLLKERSRPDNGYGGEIAAVIMPLLQARQMAQSKCAAIGRRLIRSVQGDANCRMLRPCRASVLSSLSPMSLRSRGPIPSSGRALSLPGPGSHRCASSREKSTVTATSRDEVTASESTGSVDETEFP
jgi:hypothetical protein